MSDKRFLPSGFEKQLSHLIEECGEVLAAAGKLQRFGADSVNPLLHEDDRETNIDWLRREITDLKHAISRIEVSMGGKSSELKNIVIRTSNYGKSGERPGDDEYIVCLVANEEHAKVICNVLNHGTSTFGDNYFRVVDVNYKLKVFEA